MRVTYVIEHTNADGIDYVRDIGGDYMRACADARRISAATFTRGSVWINAFRDDNADTGPENIGGAEYYKGERIRTEGRLT